MPIDLDRLKANLLTSGLHRKDQPLFQVINQLIEAFKNLITLVNAGGGSGGAGGSALLQYLTSDDETGSLPNSRELLAGIGISFDDSVANERTINATGDGESFDFVVMSDGVTPIPEPIDDGFGNFIYIPYGEGGGSSGSIVVGGSGLSQAQILKLVSYRG